MSRPQPPIIRFPDRHFAGLPKVCALSTPHGGGCSLPAPPPLQAAQVSQRESQRKVEAAVRRNTDWKMTSLTTLVPLKREYLALFAMPRLDYGMRALLLLGRHRDTPGGYAPVSTRILGRRTTPFTPSLIPNRVPHDFTPRSLC